MTVGSPRSSIPTSWSACTLVAGDITDLPALERVLDEHGITNVIHLAALQVPFCRADPPLGAAVNVVGTVNVFEAVRRRASTGAPVVYAGSIGMYSPSDVDPATGRLEEDAEAHPGNHYGVYKLANEGNARIYWRRLRRPERRPPPDDRLWRGPRPGDDQQPDGRHRRRGAAASRSRSRSAASTLFQYAEDVAKTLLLASRADPVGARVFNLGGDAVAIATGCRDRSARAGSRGARHGRARRSCRSPPPSPTNRSPRSGRSR